MGDAADMALEAAEGEYEAYADWCAGRMTLDEAYARGIVDELGVEYPQSFYPTIFKRNYKKEFESMQERTAAAFAAAIASIQ